MNPVNKSFARWSWVSVSIYVVFAFYFTFAYWRSSYLVRDLSNLVLLPGLTLLLFAHWKNYKLLRAHPQIGMSKVLTYGLIMSLTAVCIPSFYSSDLFSYINAGWQQSQYHLNPYSHLLIAAPNFTTDKMFTDVWSLNPCPYGFAYAHLCKILTHLSFGHRQAAIFIFKSLNLAVYFAIAALVYLGTRKFSTGRADLNTYLWLCSPFVLMHALAHAHNDIIMAFFLVASLLTAVTGPALAVIPLLACGVLTKYVCVLAFPFVLWFLIKRKGWLSACLSIVLSVLLSIGLSWSYLQEYKDFRWIEMKADLAMNLNSLAACLQQIGFIIEKLLYHHQKNATFEAHLDSLIAAVRMTGVMFLALSILWLLYKAVRRGNAYSIVQCAHSCLVVMILATSFVSPRFYPWYVLMYFPVALWLPAKSEWRRLAITLTCSQLFAVTFIGHGHINNFLLLTCVPAAVSIWRWRNLPKVRSL